MIPLDSPRWLELTHAYGPAADIPDLLRALEEFPGEASSNNEPWFTLWSSLAHQGDIYTASYAAVPHIVRIAATAPERTTMSFLHMPTRIEVARHALSGAPPIPPDVEPAYVKAWRDMPTLVAACLSYNRDPEFGQCAAAAICACTGQPAFAELILEISSDLVPGCLTWVLEQ